MTKIKLRRGTVDQWIAHNPILSSGEVGLETDARRLKIGNGLSFWNDLPYWFTDVSWSGEGPPDVGSVDQTGSYKGLARNPDLIVVGTITRDVNGAATSAAVEWPNGTPGMYTATLMSTAFPGAVDAYKITYGSPISVTYTQPAVTRDSSGAVSQIPEIVVS